MRYWKVAPGDRGSLWVEQRENSCIAIGWNEVNNLRKYKGDEQIKKKFKGIKDYEGSSPRQLLMFYHDVIKEDKIVASSGPYIFGIGTVAGGYKFDNDLSYCHSKPVRWNITFWNPIDIYDDIKISTSTREKLHRQATVKELTKDEWEKIEIQLSEMKTPFKNLTNWDGLPCAPTTEQEVIILFSKLTQCLKMKILRVSTRFPDALLQVKEHDKWISKSVEFELYASGFESHLEDLDEVDCDMIICWENDWKKKPVDIEVIELKNVLLGII